MTRTLRLARLLIATAALAVLGIRPAGADALAPSQAVGCSAVRAVPNSAGAQGRPESVVREASGGAGPGLEDALRRAQIPQALVANIVMAFARDADLPRSLPSDARFWVVYEARMQGGRVAEARVRCATIDDGTKLHQIYRFDTPAGAFALVHDDGSGIAWIDLAEPVAGAPVTSPFGWRIHPVFGDRRFHRGIDLGAAAGTPVVAAASGVVVGLRSKGNYGKHVIIRHDQHLQTCYAHLARFAHGLRVGSRVERGQRVGFVGRSGVATGPHLYFEVFADRVQIDPERVSAGFPIQLTTRELAGIRRSGEGVGDGGDRRMPSRKTPRRSRPS